MKRSLLSEKFIFILTQDGLVLFLNKCGLYFHILFVQINTMFVCKKKKKLKYIILLNEMHFSSYFFFIFKYVALTLFST